MDNNKHLSLIIENIKIFLCLNQKKDTEISKFYLSLFSTHNRIVIYNCLYTFWKGNKDVLINNNTKLLNFIFLISSIFNLKEYQNESSFQILYSDIVNHIKSYKSDNNKLISNIHSIITANCHMDIEKKEKKGILLVNHKENTVQFTKKIDFSHKTNNLNEDFEKENENETESDDNKDKTFPIENKFKDYISEHSKIETLKEILIVSINLYNIIILRIIQSARTMKLT